MDEYQKTNRVPMEVQRAWAQRSIENRLSVLRNLRLHLAESAQSLLDAFPRQMNRTPADSLSSELVPLLDACRFLEKEAKQILAVKHLGRRGRPFWLSGLESSVERVPHGTVLVIGPANYPLFLPGVQVLQALAAGNAVVWKPGTGGERLARIFNQEALESGLPEGVLRVTNDSVEAGMLELERHPDKVYFTGSSSTGQSVLKRAAELVIPVVAELSGCDAAILLADADTTLAADALEFSMRLNGSSTCMAPRRLFMLGKNHDAFLGDLCNRFARMEPNETEPHSRRALDHMLENAREHGAQVIGDSGTIFIKPILVLNGTPAMSLAKTDLGLPVLIVLQAGGIDELIAMHFQCPYALTAAIFGGRAESQALAAKLKAGSILINDLIVPTADPRVPFGGRGASGYGVTRGAEGLLEMTVAKVIAVRSGTTRRHFAATTKAHEALFHGAIAMVHGRTWAKKWKGLRQMVVASRNLKN